MRRPDPEQVEIACRRLMGEPREAPDHHALLKAQREMDGQAMELMSWEQDVKRQATVVELRERRLQIGWWALGWCAAAVLILGALEILNR